MRLVIAAPTREVRVALPPRLLGEVSRLASVCAAPRRFRVSFVRVESGVDPVALRDARLRMGLTQG